MTPLPEDITDRDIRAWLDGCYFVAVTKKGNQLMQFRGTDADRDGNPVVTGTRPGMHRDRPSRYAIRNVRTHWPLCGSVNVEGTGAALYVQREIQRQWRRSLCPRHLSVSLPGAWRIAADHGATVVASIPTNRPGDPALLNALFDPQYPAIDEALARLDDGRAYSVAVHPQVIVLGTGSREVYYRGNISAEIEEGDRLVPFNGYEEGARINKLMSGRFIL